jgi:hypothetical protein
MSDLNKIAKMIQDAAMSKNQRKTDQERQYNEYLAGKIGKDLAEVLKPYLEKLVQNSKLNALQIEEAIAGAIDRAVIKLDTTPQVNVNVPDVIVPEIKIPSVNYTPPKIEIPDIKMPEEMEVKGWINLMGYDRGLLKNPIPVQLRDAQGNPMKLFENLTQMVSGGGGGQVTVMNGAGNPVSITGTVSLSGASGTSAVNVVDSSGIAYSGSNPVPVTLSSGSLTSTGAYLLDGDGNYRGTVPISGTVVVSSITASTAANIVDSTGVAYSGANPLPVSVTGSLTSTGAYLLNADGTYRDTMPISGTVAVSGITNTVGAAIVDTVGTAYTTSNPFPVTGTVVVSSVTASSASALVDSSGVQYSGTNPVPVNNTQWNSVTPATGLNETNSGVVRVVQMTDSAASVSATQVGTWNITTLTGITNSVAASLVDSSGIQYSGSNPVPITIVTGALTSTIAVGDTLARTADIGAAPIKVGGIARQTNPTAYADGDRTNFTSDDLGRQLTRPVQVRDLIFTAYVTKATGSAFGTETTLLAASATNYHDLLYIMGTNDSTASVNCDVRAGTAGNVVFTFCIPSGGTAGVSLPVPIPQDHTGNNWTIDLPDISGTNVTVSALFSREL